MLLRLGVIPLLLVTGLLAASTAFHLPSALAQSTAPLTAAYHVDGQNSTHHTGQGSLIQVSVRFSQTTAPFAVSTPSVRVEGGSLQGMSSSRVNVPTAGRVPVATFVLVASGDGPVTFRLVPGQSCADGGICSARGTTLETALPPRIVPGPVAVAFESGSYTATYGMPAEVAVNLDRNPERQVNVPLSAEYSEDLTPEQVNGIPASLTFNPGETRKVFTLAPVEGASGAVEMAFGDLPAGTGSGGVTSASVAVHNSQVWDAVMAVAAFEGFLGYGTIAGETEGSLTPAGFSWRGAEYRVRNILVSQSDGEDVGGVELEVSPGFKEGVDGLTLIIGDLALNLSDGKVNARQFYWEGIVHDLNQGDSVDVELRESHPALSIRSRDGRYNNAGDPTWGQAQTELLRRATVSYPDRVSSAPTWLPSARLVSNEAMEQSRSVANSAQASSFLWQWGQFLDHDIGHTPLGPSAEGFPISVPAGDPVFGRATLAFVRSQFYPGTGTGPDNPREQMNNLTAFIDASQVYGSDWSRAYALRANDGTGKLRTSGDGDYLVYNRNGLDNDGGASRRDLFLSGDVRANEQVGLTALHTLFLREHNRLTEELPPSTPTWAATKSTRLPGRRSGHRCRSLPTTSSSRSS